MKYHFIAGIAALCLLLPLGTRAEDNLPVQLVFAPARIILTEAHIAALSPVAVLLAEDRQVRLKLAGTASEDEAGNGFEARALALERALVVRAWLVKRSGVKPHRMIVLPRALSGDASGGVMIERLSLSPS